MYKLSHISREEWNLYRVIVRIVKQQQQQQVICLKFKLHLSWKERSLSLASFSFLNDRLTGFLKCHPVTLDTRIQNVPNFDFDFDKEGEWRNKLDFVLNMLDGGRANI